MSIAGKVALVTGGAKGIGRAIVLRLARDGADVAIADLDEEKANAVADDVRVMSRKSIVMSPTSPTVTRSLLPSRGLRASWADSTSS